MKNNKLKLYHCDTSYASHKVRYFCKAHEALHDPHIRTLSYVKRWQIGLLADGKKEELLQLAEQHPNKARGLFLKRIAQEEITQQELDDAEQAIQSALQQMEGLLTDSQSDFLFGQQYTMADAVAVAGLYRIATLDMQDMIEQLPRVAEYYEAMQHRKSYQLANLC